MARRRASGCRRTGEAEVERLYRTRYQGFTARHFHEHLVQDHRFRWGYTWTKLFLQSKGLLEKAPRRGAHRRKRPRRPLPGMMLHQDGSRHAWLAGQAALDLIVTMDDATSAIYSAFLVEEEGTASTFRALAEVFARHGLPLSLYTDRGSHYFHTPEAGGKVDREQPDPGRPGAGAAGRRAYRGLFAAGARPLGAGVPDPAGPAAKELALAGITTVEAANAFIRDVYLPAHNARFAVKAEQEGSPSSPIPGVDLDEILCVQEERQVGNDNCVSFQRRKLQIPESPLRPHFVKARVKVQPYHDGTHAIFHGPRCLGRYDARTPAVEPSGGAERADPSRPATRLAPAQGRQGRFAPRSAVASAILDRPSARRPGACQVGAGKWC